MKKLTVTLDDTSATSIDTLLAHYDPFLTAHAVASAALRVGLDAFVKEPTQLLAILRANAARETEAAASTDPTTTI
jgi:hypothetical protein